MFCNQCGKQLADGTKFCSGCGKPFAGIPNQAPDVTPAASPVPNVTPATTATPAPVYQQPNYQMPNFQAPAAQKPKNSLGAKELGLIYKFAGIFSAVMFIASVFMPIFQGKRASDSINLMYEELAIIGILFVVLGLFGAIMALADMFAGLVVAGSLGLSLFLILVTLFKTVLDNSGAIKKLFRRYVEMGAGFYCLIIFSILMIIIGILGKANKKKIA